MENNDGALSSNRSNFESKAEKKNLDKLSECSSLTRFEANNEGVKTSMVLTNDGGSPLKNAKPAKSSIENFEEVETKKIVENLSEVSSILQEDSHSQNFSVSDQIMIENLDRNPLEKQNYFGPINENLSKNGADLLKKKNKPIEEGKEIVGVYNSQIQNFSSKQNNSKAVKFHQPFLQSNTQTNFYPSSSVEKNRSNSASSQDQEKKDPPFPNNLKPVFSNGSFIRTCTEKGFYDSRPQPPYHYVKYGSINLQDGIQSRFQDKSQGYFLLKIF